MVELNIGTDRTQNYKAMVSGVDGLIAGEPDVVANLANVSALIHQYMDDINWVGFYILKGDTLVLGPFQGKPACVRIAHGKGVCGAAATRQETVVVDDVHSFPGHIACDTASNSEIVLPIYQNSQVYGVLDVDSPSFSRFGPKERTALEAIASKLSAFLSASGND